MKTTVIVPFFNNKATLERCVNSILHCQPAPDRIIFVDDGSTDTGSEELNNLPVTLLRVEHKGRAGALNAGLDKITDGLVLFTDADCIVTTDWVGKHIKFFQKDHWGGVGGNLLPSKLSVVETAKVLRYVHEFEEDISLKGKYVGVCLNGNNMAILYEALKEVGGFDESYIHGADADLTQRLLSKGYRLLRTTKITTTHMKVDSISSFLSTCFLRGSTVRFHRQEPVRVFRSLILSPLKNFVLDVKNISRLKVFDAKRSWVMTGLSAAIINLFAAWVNTAGKIYFNRKFNRRGM